MPRVKRIHIGDNVWVKPVASFGECEHPREFLRFDPRFSMPIAVYCTDCGEAYIHPFHGLTKEQIEERKKRGRELAERLGME